MRRFLIIRKVVTRGEVWGGCFGRSKRLCDMHSKRRHHQWHKCEMYIRLQISLVQCESYFAFFKTFTSSCTECLVSQQWSIQQLLLLNVSWIYTSGVAQTAFLKIICKQLMCFLNSQCYVKRHNIFSLTKYQLSSPHSLPLIYWRWGPRSSETLWILTVLKIRWGGFFCNVVLEFYRS